MRMYWSTGGESKVKKKEFRVSWRNKER